MKKVIIVISLLSLILMGCSNKKTAEKDNVVSSMEAVTETENEISAENETKKENESDTLDETVIFQDESFDFNANFEDALKSSAQMVIDTKEIDNTNSVNKEENEALRILNPVNNFQGSFNWKKNLIDLTWKDPDDSKFTHVEIRNNKSKDVIIVPKGKQTYSFTPKDKEEHKYIITACDSEGLKSVNIGCVVDDPYLFTSFKAPTVANTGKGKFVIAEIKGINFDKYGIEEKDFRIFCPSNSFITSKSEITLLDDTTLSATIRIPNKSGNYAIIASCGEVSFTGYFTVNDYASKTIGTVMYKNKKPEAIIAGYDSLGYPFGVALTEQGSLKWAMEGSFGYDNCFNSIVCEPDVVGVNSAINAHFTGDIDGDDNWEVICTEDENCKDENGELNNSYIKKNYPIFYYALNYGENWFVPSISELSQIYKNREVINTVLEEINGKKLKNEFYWSSTQNDYSNYNACAVKFVNGAIYKYYKKGNAVSVRCIKKYK